MPAPLLTHPGCRGIHRGALKLPLRLGTGAVSVENVHVGEKNVSSRAIRYRPLRDALLASVREIITDVTPQLTLQTQLRPAGWTKKDETDATRDIDLKALEIYKQTLSEHLLGTKALLCSEENPTGEVLTDTPTFPNILIIVDPIDNTDGAIHASPAYSAVSVYHRPTQSVIAAAVADLYRSEIYYADEELGAVRFVATQPHEAPVPMRPNLISELNGAYISLYTLKPKRLLAASGIAQLLEGLGEHGRVDNIGGAAALCKVAAGYIDAAVEMEKGFQVYDLFPGAYILQRSGGVCIRPDNGHAVSLEMSVQTRDDLSHALKLRQPFVAAGNHALAFKIFAALSAQT